MAEASDLIFIQQDNGADKSDLIQRFRQVFIHPFQKQRFYNQWQDAPISLRFRLTNRCNENCARCFECSGPNNPSKAIPVDDVAFYANNTESSGVFMTGGEWSLVYDTNSHYMRKIFDKLDLSKSDAYVIQTNARWINGPHSTEILDDIKYIQSKLKQQNRILKLDMSVDRYRSANSINSVRDVICAVASDKKFDNTKIRIMSCALDYKMANERVLIPDYFAAHGIKLKLENRALWNPYFQVCYANDVRIVIHEEGPTMRIGRAKQNGIGYQIFHPQLQCAGLQPDNTNMELSLREDGMVKWHNWYDWDIMTPYKDANNQNKPLKQICSELVDMAWSRLLRHNIKNTALNLLPIYGQARQIYIEKQIKKSYEENRKQFTIVVQSVKSYL